MADTAIPITTLTAGASTAVPAGTAIVAADNHVITLGRIPADEIVLLITNTTASTKVATLTAGDAPPSTAGEPAATTASLTAGNTTPTRAFIRCSSAKHQQADGTLVVTVESAMTGTISALHVPVA
jgi:hypothetical protein